MNDTGVVVLIVALVLSSAFALVWQRRDGRVRAQAGGRVPDFGPDAAAPDSGIRRETANPLAQFAADSGVTVLQFSAEVCSQCAAARRLLQRVSRNHPQVTHREVDAGEHLDLVRSLRIMRTPTILLLDSAGKSHFRASGVPREGELLAAISAISAADAVC